MTTMTEIKINGIALLPQPATVTWQPADVGARLNGTQYLGAYELLVLRCVPTAGGAVYFNWPDFENQVLTSIRIYPPGEDGQTGLPVTYTSGVVSQPIKEIRAEPGGILRGIEMVVAVVF